MKGVEFGTQAYMGRQITFQEKDDVCLQTYRDSEGSLPTDSWKYLERKYSNKKKNKSNG